MPGDGIGRVVLDATVRVLEAAGFDADYVIWNCDDYRMIPYHLGSPDIAFVYCNGKMVYST